MTITKSDVKLMQPERLTDESDGGGSMTGLEIVDGDINNLFDDISRVNRTYGNVSMRKSFLKVATAGADLYLDSHAVINQQPSDPNVSSLLFTTDNFYDERTEARQRIESFVIAGPRSGLMLRGNQLAGQQSIICYSGVTGVQAPVTGETYMLQTGDDISTRQFVKVTDVTETSETFTYTVSDSIGNTLVKNWKVTQWVVNISTMLERDFPNIDPHPYNEQTTYVHTTTASSSAKYYGTSQLSEAISAGATAIQVDDTFAPIIPTASSETALTDQRPGGFIDTFIATGTPIQITANTNAGIIYFPTAILPGSISFTVGGVTFSDANERLERSDSSVIGFESVTIDYAGGVITVLAETLGASNQIITYTPAAVRTLIPHTGLIEIDDNNRNFTYVLQLNALPARKSFQLSYQYSNKWYTVYDDGTGNLIGDGSGAINYATGSVSVVLLAQPDASSSLFYLWTDAQAYNAGEGSAFAGTSPTKLRLKNKNLIPGSITITWTVEGETKTATDDGAGKLTGDATGGVEYELGVIEIEGTITDEETSWVVDYQYDPPAERVSTSLAISEHRDRDTNKTFTLPHAELKAGSISITLQIAIKKRVYRFFGADLERWNYRTVTLNDDGDGNLYTTYDTKTIAGVINYKTGAVELYTKILLAEKTKATERWEVS